MADGFGTKKLTLLTCPTHLPTTLAMLTMPLVTTPQLMPQHTTLLETHTKHSVTLVLVIMTPLTIHQMLPLMMQDDQLARRFPKTFPTTMERQLSKSTIVPPPSSDQLLSTQNALTELPAETPAPLLRPLGLQPESGSSVKARLSPVKLRWSVALALLHKFNQNVQTVTHALTML